MADVMGLSPPESDNEIAIGSKIPIPIIYYITDEVKRFFLFFSCICARCMLYFVYDIDHSSHLQPGPVDMLSPAIFVFGFSELRW